jgi:polyadenylate-binding protein
VEVLRAKLADAKVVLDSEDDPEERPQAKLSPPATPQSKKIVVRVMETPQTPDLSSRGPSAASSPLPATPGTISSGIAGSSTHTVTSLAKLPAAEIIRLANLPSTSGFPFPKPSALTVQTTDEFIDGILDKPPQAQKQQLGDKL